VVSQRVQRRIERWNTLARAGVGLVVLGVVGKSAASLGVVVLLAGLVTSTGVILTGVGIALLGFAAWWGSARTIAARVDLSHGRDVAGLVHPDLVSARRPVRRVLGGSPTSAITTLTATTGASPAGSALR